MANALYPVPQAWADQALINAAQYQAMYQASINDPEGFWRAEAQRIDWIKPFSIVKKTSFNEGDFGIEWFSDGTLNLCANALDRHLADHGDRIAILWEPDKIGRAHV